MKSKLVSKPVFLLKFHLERGNQRTLNGATVETRFNDGTFAEDFISKERICNKVLPQMAYCLLGWKCDVQNTNGGKRVESWYHALRSNDSRAWIDKIFSSKKSMHRLFPRPNGLHQIAVNDTLFSRTNVTIQLIDGKSELEGDEARRKLAVELGMVAISDEEQDRLEVISSEVLKTNDFNCEGKNITSKAYWLGQLSRLDSYLQNMIESGGVIGALISETRKATGYFSLEFVESEKTRIEAAKKELLLRFEDDLDALKLTVSDVVDSLNSLLQAILDESKTVKCIRCIKNECEESSAPTRHDLGMTAESVKKIHQAAKKSKKDISSFKSKLSKEIARCRTKLVELAKDCGLYADSTKSD